MPGKRKLNPPPGSLPVCGSLPRVRVRGAGKKLPSLGAASRSALTSAPCAAAAASPWGLLCAQGSSICWPGWNTKPTAAPHNGDEPARVLDAAELVPLALLQVRSCACPPTAAYRQQPRLANSGLVAGDRVVTVRTDRRGVQVAPLCPRPPHIATHCHTLRASWPLTSRCGMRQDAECILRLGQRHLPRG